MGLDRPGGQAFCFEGNKRHGVLLLHGFTGTPGHMRWLGERIHERGYTVLAPLLPGHGSTVEDMRKSDWRKWLAEAREAYVDLREKCEIVTVGGLSMGGALALILAEEYPVDGLICMAAAIRLVRKYTWIAPLMSLAVPFVSHAPHDEAEEYDELREYNIGYDGFPLSKVHDLKKLSRIAERNMYSVLAPALIVQPVGDLTVDGASVRVIEKGIASSYKQILWLEKSRHVCTIGPDRQALLDAILIHLRHIDDTNSLAR